MATTERAEREVVVELGVPGPISEGVAGSEGGGGTACIVTLAAQKLKRRLTQHTVDQSWTARSHLACSQFDDQDWSRVLDLRR